MQRERNWQTGEGLLGIADPAEVDAAFERNERHVGTAVIGLVLNSEALSIAAPRVLRALHSDSSETRQLAFVAVGDAARRFQELTPEIYVVLRENGLGGPADSAIKDVLTFVPFQALPGWLKRLKITLKVKRFLLRK